MPAKREENRNVCMGFGPGLEPPIVLGMLLPD
jgi:hypothetical protein